MIWIWLVLGLAVIWVVLWFRSRRSGRALRLSDPRRLMALKLEDDAAKNEEAGRYSTAQTERLKAIWLRTDPPPGTENPPEEFDPRNQNHLMFADAIRQQYAQSISVRSGPFADCTVKPSALLPYPKTTIGAALELFVALGRGDTWSPFIQQDSITPDDLAVVERSLQLLDTFVDVSREDVPRDPTANMEFAKEHLRRG